MSRKESDWLSLEQAKQSKAETAAYREELQRIHHQLSVMKGIIHMHLDGVTAAGLLDVPDLRKMINETYAHCGDVLGKTQGQIGQAFYNHVKKLEAIIDEKRVDVAADLILQVDDELGGNEEGPYVCTQCGNLMNKVRAGGVAVGMKCPNCGATS